MNKKISELISKVQVIVESYALGEEAYSSKIDNLVDELVLVKNNLKKGKNRKFFRKESSRIQNAIQTLRYLKRKSERELMKNNSKILISESELINILNQKGSIDVNEATLSDSQFSTVFDDMISAKDDFYSAYKGLTSSSGDSGTSNDVLGIIKIAINESGNNIKNLYNSKHPDIGGRYESPSLIELIPNSNISDFALCSFHSTLWKIAKVIATYDNKFYSRSESTGAFGDGTGGGLDVINPIAPVAPGASAIKYVGQKNEFIDKDNITPVDTLGSIEQILSQLNSNLNKIIKGFNELFKGISEIPENQTYTNSVYSATNIANDITRIFYSDNVDIDGNKIKKVIMKNIEDKQDFGYFSLNPNKKVQLEEGSVRKLASKIVGQLKDYYIEELQKSKYYMLYTVTKLDTMVYISSKGKHRFTDIGKIEETFNKVISDLRNIVIK